MLLTVGLFTGADENGQQFKLVRYVRRQDNDDRTDETVVKTITGRFVTIVSKGVYLVSGHPHQVKSNDHIAP